MKVCPRCETPIPAGASACAGCGADASEPEETLQAPDPPASAAPTMGMEAPVVVPPLVSPTAGHLPIGAEIGGRYRVERLLGRGGMGAVYQAEDLALGRRVALKVIRPDLAEDPGALERFKREVQLASEVTHRHVLRVYDLGESGGLLFLTMQYVEGETLADLLEREGRLPVPRAVALFREICEGLAAAHERGVVHRDLKPQNILLDGSGRVHVADFGLARGVAEGLAEAGLTRTGDTLGTPDYMSPEQVRGQEAGPQSDIYALGLILYEMVTGQRPFQGKSSLQAMLKRLQGPPRPVVELNPEVPPNLSAVLERCLAVAPEHRYGAAGEILADLDAETVRLPVRLRLARRRWRRLGLAAAALAAAVVTVSAIWLLDRGESGTGEPTATPQVPLVGVAPFVNRTGDPGLDWYGEGVARLISDNLAQSHHLQALSPERAAALASAGEMAGGAEAAAAAAGLDHLVLGEILQGGRGLTLAARIVETKSGREVASRRIDGLTEQALLEASDEIALAARRAAGVPLEETVDAFAADFAAANTEAYEAYLAGLDAFHRYRFRQAARGFETALEKAPDFTMARARLAHVLAAEGRTDDALRQIEQAAGEAGRLPQREARYIRATQALIERRFDDAIAGFREILADHPYETEARRHLAEIYVTLGRWEEVEEEAAMLERLAPEAPTTWSLLGSAYLGQREFSRAVSALQRYVELAPEEPNAHHLLADSYRAQGELELAAQEYRRALELDLTFHYATVALATVEVLQGELDAAAALLAPLVADVRALPTHRIDAAFALAHVRRAQGRFREAAEILEGLHGPLAEEGVRKAMALAVRGTARMEVGDMEAARRLIEEAVASSPGVPTRYLFAQGLLSLRVERLDEVRATAARILHEALPPEDPDRTEEKAAAYLEGVALLAEGKAEEAIQSMSRAVSLSGYEYRRYRLELARAYLAAGRHQEAMAAARDAAAALDPADPRLDLELDRRRALLVLAETELAMGRPGEAAEEARALLELWEEADPGFREAQRAMELARGEAA